MKRTPAGRGGRTRRNASEAGGDAATRPGARSGATRWIALATIAVSVVVITLIRLRSSTMSARQHTSAPVDTMTITNAYLEAQRLLQLNQFMESLPYYRRVGHLLPQSVRDHELLIAFALRQASMESREDARQPITRSSAERVAFLREALEHLDSAQHLSRNPRELTEVRLARAKVLHLWGFAWEALLEIRTAEAADPQGAEVAGMGDLYAHYLRHPEEPLPAGAAGDFAGP